MGIEGGGEDIDQLINWVYIYTGLVGELVLRGCIVCGVCV
jgi:hypothetical protein